MHASALRRYGESLLDLLVADTAVGSKSLPERLPGPLTAAQRDQVKVLKRGAERIATDMGVAPQMLASGRDFEALVRGEDAEPLAWQGWRRQQVIEPLKDLIKGGAA